MRKIAASYIFPVIQPPVKNGILICEDDGTIIEIQQTIGNLKETQGLEFYSGILVPGFVNTHCHLELSHLKGKIPAKTGIPNFIKSVTDLRETDEKETKEHIFKQDKLMYAAGIAAVGDISNSDLSLETKKNSKIFYHTFVEALGFSPSHATKAFERACLIQNKFLEQRLKASVTPHASYSVSLPLLEKIKEKAIAEQSIISIHNQESLAEEQFFKDGSGSLSLYFKHNLGLDVSHRIPTGKSSFISTLPFLPDNNPLLLIHNTFTKREEIHFLRQQRASANTFLVLCPNSNLYIENQLPPIALFQKEKLNICIGTDSLASNNQLSVLNEIITLQQHFPELLLEELVQWATFNGALALQMEHTLGSFKKGKRPGVNLITGINFKEMKLTGASKVKRLM